MHTRCFVKHGMMDSDGKSLVLGSVIIQSQRSIPLQVTAVPGTVGFSRRVQPCQCQLSGQEAPLNAVRSCVALCCVLGFQCLQGHELEGRCILAHELLSQFPCVCLEASGGLLCSIARKGNPLSFLASTQAAESLRFFFFNITAEYFFKVRVHILRGKPF